MTGKTGVTGLNVDTKRSLHLKHFFFKIYILDATHLQRYYNKTN